MNKIPIKCRKCKYYRKADSEHADDGCYYWHYGSVYGFGCYITEQLLKWCPLVISILALIRSFLG